MNSDRLPPHSDESEKAVLGCFITEPDASLDAWMELTKLRHEAFYDVRSVETAKAIFSLSDSRQPVNQWSVKEALTALGRLEDAGGIQFLTELVDSSPGAASLEYFAGIVLEKYDLRQLIKTGNEIISSAFEEKESAEIRTKAEGELTQNDIRAFQVLDSRAIIESSVKDLQSRQELRGQIIGVPTGIERFDRITQGMQYGEQTIIGARPSVGKTAFALKAFCNAAIDCEIPSLFFTLEMTTAALMRRVYASRLSIPLNSLKSGNLTNDEVDKIAHFQQCVLRNKPFYIVEAVQGMRIDAFDSIVRRYVRKHGIKFAVGDYLQKFHPANRHEKRTYEVGEVSTMSKGVAAKNNIAVLMLAQLNREMEKDKGRMPRLADLGDSKQIECDGDLIGLLHRPRSADDDPEGKKGTIIIAKQRDGELDVVPYHYEGKFVRCENPPSPKLELPHEQQDDRPAELFEGYMPDR